MLLQYLLIFTKFQKFLETTASNFSLSLSIAFLLQGFQFPIHWIMVYHRSLRFYFSSIFFYKVFG